MIYILLPAFNERKALPKLFNTIEQAFTMAGEEYTVVVVDDGSTDETVKIAQDYAVGMPVIVLQHATNKGLGAAMNTGLSYLSRVAVDTDYIVALDADNTHNPQLIFTMIDKSREGQDVVIASRYASGGREIGLTLHRKLLSRGASVLLSAFFRVKGAKDYTCGFRAYSARIIKLAFQFYGEKFVEEKGFVCMAEILVKLDRLSARVGEVGLVLRYDLKEGASKMQVGKTIFGYFRLIFTQKVFASSGPKDKGEL